MSTASTHVLDAARGLPAAGLAVTLVSTGSAPERHAVTDADGRISWGEVTPGRHVLAFATGDWFGEQDRETFFGQVVLDVVLGPDHTHVALLLSPFAYTTYRGS
ncbi:hydroxyisourate hydrolase [Promicromonospora iranensis]|uniref:5-hydroxyisourate hydrolase n=1 Tax=Promicromonospora iranensis TaxID=1105144 RepID=A0ABU2CTF9_9MICO|nr:hydroxyisourate hydrolase [Promicromonospora iranensis]MDR7384635.1 5-hydroxyisourate hydrolase [Promicromonospora iranensis]